MTKPMIQFNCTYAYPRRLSLEVFGRTCCLQAEDGRTQITVH